MVATHYLARSLPEPLAGLEQLALNLRWSWNHGGDRLWEKLDHELWDATGNPWLLLESVSEARLRELAEDPDFLAELRARLDEREEHLAGDTWFDQHERADLLRQPVAYFSMEFGISESLPIYSGGLGVLAGDHLKTACDLGVPLVGIGLLYQQGYFRQALDADGHQLEFYPYNDPTMLPVVPLRDSDGAWVRIHVELPGRTVHLRAWQVEVGRRWLYLLDSNDPLNRRGDRGLTSALYGGNDESRLQQEVLLGIGGWRLLERLGLDCPVCHLNEGHAAFALLERTRACMQRMGLDFDEALAVTRAGTLFTTHTPVPAGFDRFPTALAARYLAPCAEQLGIALDRLLALGRAPEDGDDTFTTAWLAVRGSGAVNGVSRLHAEVSRRVFQPLFPRWPRCEVPIGHVTNGVHVPGWDSAEADDLWTSACGAGRWRGTLETVQENVCCLDDATLWEFRARARSRLIANVRDRLRRQGPPGRTDDALDRDVLTLGFARRFAEYKRPNLLLQDPERLERLLTHPQRPVQLMLAGKAHPLDSTGQRLIEQWTIFMQRPRVRGRVIFLEDYDLATAGELVQGVDLWVNTPRRPWEACGTSGMKVLVNGGLNLSELDGWWAEAYEPDMGWAIGTDNETDATTGCAETDADDGTALYRTLEQEVIPAFYERDEHGVPRAWLARMRQSMARLTPRFSSNRMLRDYVEQYYLPLADATAERLADEAAIARRLVAWRTLLEQHWGNVHFGAVTVQSCNGGHEFRVQVYLDEIPDDAVRVELFADPLADEGNPHRVRLEPVEHMTGTTGGRIFHATVPADRPSADYTARIVPAFSGASVPLESGLILWQR